MLAPIIAAIPTGIVAAVAKGTATVGGSIAGGVASYYIVDSIRGEDQIRRVTPYSPQHLKTNLIAF